MFDDDFNNYVTFSDEAKNASENFINMLKVGNLKYELEPSGFLTEAERRIYGIRKQAYYDSLYKKDASSFSKFLHSSMMQDIYDYTQTNDEKLVKIKRLF